MLQFCKDILQAYRSTPSVPSCQANTGTWEGERLAGIPLEEWDEATRDNRGRDAMPSRDEMERAEEEDNQDPAYEDDRYWDVSEPNHEVMLDGFGLWT